MNYVKSLNLFGVEVQQIPSITGSGAPTTATEGAVGCFYMDTNNGDIYKCIAVTDGAYTWEEFKSSGSTEGGVPVTFIEYGGPTFAEMEEMLRAGKFLICKDRQFHMPIYDWNVGSNISFRRFSTTECFNYYCTSADTWATKTTLLSNERLESIESTIGDIDSALDSIIAIQNSLIGGGSE